MTFVVGTKGHVPGLILESEQSKSGPTFLSHPVHVSLTT